MNSVRIIDCRNVYNKANNINIYDIMVKIQEIIKREGWEILESIKIASGDSKFNPDTGNEEHYSGELDLSNFINLKSIKIDGQKFSKLTLGNNPQLKQIEIANNKIKEINIKKVLPQLEIVNCSSNLLTELDLTNCPNLKILDCSQNFLKEIKGRIVNLTNLRARSNSLNKNSLFSANPATLRELDIRNNNFNFSDLEVYEKFTELRIFLIGNDNEKLKNGIYNKFAGSLSFLWNLGNLERLNIGNTDLNGGLEYLPESLKEIEFEQGIGNSLSLTSNMLKLMKSHELKKTLNSFKNDNNYSYDLTE